VWRRIAEETEFHGLKLLLMTRLGEDTNQISTASDRVAGSVVKPVTAGRLKAAVKSAADEEPRAGLHPIDKPAERESPAARKFVARILLAEDNPINQEVTVAILGGMGYQVSVVPNGLEAVKTLQQVPYDLVLMDCEMPEMDGYEATRRIRDEATKVLNPKIPILAITASAMPGDRERCLQSGMDDYLPKPIEPERVAQVLARWLRTVEPANSGGGPGAASTNDQVFDGQALVNRLMRDESLARKVVHAFVETAPTHITALRAHLEVEDAAAVRRAAHALKGAAANVSAGALRAVASATEEAGRAGELGTVAALLPKMEDQLERLREALQQAGWV